MVIGRSRLKHVLSVYFMPDSHVCSAGKAAVPVLHASRRGCRGQAAKVCRKPALSGDPHQFHAQQALAAGIVGPGRLKHGWAASVLPLAPHQVLRGPVMHLLMSRHLHQLPVTEARALEARLGSKRAAAGASSGAEGASEAPADVEAPPPATGH